MLKQYALLVCLGGIVSGIASAQTQGKVDFRRDVQPIFRDNCYGCHGATQKMNGFRLDRRRDAMLGGTAAVIGPGNAAGSRLYQKLVGGKFGMRMPPTGPLPPSQIAIVKAWIDQGAEWPDDLSGETPATRPDPNAARLMTALRNGDVRAFRTLLARNPSAAKRKGPGGTPPLMYAVLYSDAAVIRLLLDAGADPNARNDARATALMWAVDDLEKTTLLVRRGADVNATSEDGRTPLLIAARLPGNTAVLKLLLERGAKVGVYATSLVGETSPLTEAAFAGDEAAMRLLLDRGADARRAGPVALAFAMRAKCRGCVALLLPEPSPALAVPAMFFVSPPLGPALGITPLLQQGGDARAKDPGGNSILALAAASEAMPVDAVKALLERGADANATIAEGESALELASRHGNTPVVELLRKAGAVESPAAANGESPAKPAATAREAVARSLPLLQRNDLAFLRRSGCVSCHNNSLTSLTVAAARKRGFSIDEQELQEQARTIGAYLETWRERVLQNRGIPGDSDTISYILLGLASVNYAADPATDAMAVFLKREQLPDGHWQRLANRPPIESSDIEVTAVSMRALQVYGPKAQKPVFDRAVARASDWLAEARAESTEDRAFQLLGLTWGGGHPELRRKVAGAILAAQRDDGGWAQLPTLSSDAYATGQTLVALRESGSLLPSDAACQRAVRFLVETQAEDGSWHVRRRAVALQPFFESGFPYGRDQFISAAATGWSATALALSFE